MLRTSLTFVVVTLIAVTFSVDTAFAQEGTITGTVVDQQEMTPIPGANVVIEELGTGAATDSEGNFQLSDVPVGTYAVTATFVGYEQQSTTVEVDAGETSTVRLELPPSAVELGNVVVTALGIEREERSLGYAVEEVQGADLEQAGETNFISTLTGKTAGTQINTSSQMGGSARITVRGASSVAGDNQPLIVIDGVPLDNSDFNSTGQISGSGGYDYGNSASMINPSEIESISILKGASASALYGSRASNGVIEITTKSGAREAGIGVSVQTGLTAGELYGLPNYQNKYGGGARPNFDENAQGQLVADFGTDQSWGPRLDGREVRQWYSYDDVNGLNGQTTPWEAHPDNVRDYFQTTLTANTDVAFSQGGETFNYRLSLNDMRQRGASPKSRLRRQTFGFNGSLDLSDRLTTSVNSRFITQGARGRPGSGYTNANGPWLQFNHFGQRQVDLSDGAPMRDIVRPNGDQRSWNWANNTTAPLEGRIIYANNPFWLRERNYQEDDMNRIFGNVQIDYELVENVTASGYARTDYYTMRAEDRVAPGSIGRTRFSGSIEGYEEEIREVQETNLGGTVDYNGDLTDEISLLATAGVNYRYNSFSRNLGRTAGGLVSPDVFTVANSIDRPDVVDYFEEKGLVGVYGDATVGYNDMVYVGGTLRNDWASTLPADNNSYLYPAINASFVFSSLPALEGSNLLSFGKVRANWSQVGRDTDPYELNLTYPAGTPYGSKPVKTLPSVLPNSELRREMTTDFEVGTRLHFFQNRVALDATYYTRSTEDLIQQVQTSAASGFDARVLNAGTISNKGVELSLDFTPVLSTESFNWDLRLNWSKNVNRVEELAEGIENLPVNQSDNTPPFGPEIVAREGEELGTFWGNGFATNDQGERIVLPGSFATYQTEGPKVLGSYRPDWLASASTTVGYNDFTLRVLVDGQKGGQIWSLSNLFGLYSGMFEETVQDNIRQLGVMPEGANSAPMGASQFFQGLFGNHEAHLYDASYIKLREATLSYSFPRSWFGNVPVQQFNVSLVGRNLATLLKYTPNFDPTAVTRSSDNLQGIEAGQMPPKRTLGVRLRATF